jgi:hypothetical protein
MYRSSTTHIFCTFLRRFSQEKTPSIKIWRFHKWTNRISYFCRCEKFMKVLLCHKLIESQRESAQAEFFNAKRNCHGTRKKRQNVSSVLCLGATNFVLPRKLCSTVTICIALTLNNFLTKNLVIMIHDLPYTIFCSTWHTLGSTCCSAKFKITTRCEMRT